MQSDWFKKTDFHAYISFFSSYAKSTQTYLVFHIHYSFFNIDSAINTTQAKSNKSIYINPNPYAI